MDECIECHVFFRMNRNVLPVTQGGPTIDTTTDIVIKSKMSLPPFSQIIR